MARSPLVLRLHNGRGRRRVSALERRDRETEVEMQNIREMGAEKLMVMKQKGQMQDIRDKQEPRSEWQ